jgi:hypothetical protein
MPCPSKKITIVMAIKTLFFAKTTVLEHLNIRPVLNCSRECAKLT